MLTDEKGVPGGGQETPQSSSAPGKTKPPRPKKSGGFPKWAIWLIVVVVILVIAGVAVGVVLAMTGGEEEDQAGNQAPVITSLTANPDSLSPFEETEITCVSEDADGDMLDYEWIYSKGQLQGVGDTVTWIAPALPKTYMIRVVVSDGNGGTDEASVEIEVEAAAATPTATPTSVATPTPTSTPSPSDGSIDIKSTPSGAVVFIDGVNTGSITPYIATHVSEGPHVVRLVYPHYEWRVESVMVYGGETAYINWALDYSATQTVIIQPDAAAGKDSYSFEGDPGSNRGTDTEIFASGVGAASMCRAYIQFDLGSLPSSAVVTDAKLGLFYEHEAAGSVAGPVGVYRIVEPWDELTITWDNDPALAAAVSATTTVTAVHTNTFVNWDIDDLVQAWVSGTFTNNGMALIDTDETTAEGYKGFYSSDCGTLDQSPKLTIQYYDPTP